MSAGRKQDLFTDNNLQTCFQFPWNDKLALTETQNIYLMQQSLFLIQTRTTRHSRKKDPDPIDIAKNFGILCKDPDYIKKVWIDGEIGNFLEKSSQVLQLVLIIFRQS